MAAKHEQSLVGKFQHVIYSPKGAIEGILIDVEKEPMQMVFKRDSHEESRAFEDLHQGQRVVIKAIPKGVSPKGDSDHPVFEFLRLVSVDGRKPSKHKKSSGSVFSGVVTRLNYARHGAANGVVLDTGDFLHTKPDGMLRLKLKVGDAVRADGESRPLSTGGGKAIEAIRVNGKLVNRA